MRNESFWTIVKLLYIKSFSDDPEYQFRERGPAATVNRAGFAGGSNFQVG